jgi:LAO/AO transport system kinase
MQRLAQEPRAFVRPSPSGGAPGGVARRTREALLLCEAAGYDLLLVETVGVGQSETAVAEMVDEFLVLHQPGSGDELQGIKRGIRELADVVAVNKADGAQASAARDAARDLSAALRLYGPREGGWTPRVCTISALEGSGFEELWGALEAHHAALSACGALERRRSAQRVRWMRALVEERVLAELDSRPGAAARRSALEVAAAEYLAVRAR